jgi:hypothetical protein
MKSTWLPLFWEPVHGTGERLMVGVIAHHEGKLVSQRLIRDDVLDALYGKQSSSPKKLIEAAISLAFELIDKVGFDTSFNQGRIQGRSATRFRDS